MTAQLLKLARTLGVPVEQLAYLADVPDADLREFRRQVTDLFVAGQEAGLRRVAQASKVIPTSITAKMVARSRGALLAARMSGVLDPSHAVDVAKRLPVDFLAEIAARLDPRHSAAIIGGLPEATIVAVGKELAAREDWITLGELVASIPDTAARATESALDGIALVRSAHLVDDAAQLERFVNLAPRDKIVEMLWATAEYDLWPEYRGTLDVLSESAIDVVRAAAEELPVEQRDRVLTEIADRRSAW
ncbi:hypothetical protein OIE68_03880 [Nocardia vinacea]|uniref:DUF2336 domain-containing protein n=1 Tax=Nocardia vinacea TaxID=96468 RepID=A0ABZ1YQW5_9NOCA|nr:hypothetical protein OIE68_03880 [Nocardia vinacea]